MSTTAPAAPPVTKAKASRGRRVRRLTRRDKLVLAVMLGIPSVIHLALVWAPTLASVYLSFTKWDGIGGFDAIHWVGLRNYREIFTIYAPFWPAVANNVIWLVFYLLVPTSFGLLLAYVLDKNIRGSRFYQGVLFTPVVLSLAVVGFIWTLIYSRDYGLINSILGTAGNEARHPIDWLGDSNINIWSVLLAASWRHTGYIMILYLAGLKSVDPALREAAALDGANEWQLFRRVVFPALKPVNIVVLAVTVIDSLRAFDIVYVINKGTNGLELLSALVVANIVGEASRIGYGSALAVLLLLISSGFIVTYMVQTFREDR